MSDKTYYLGANAKLYLGTSGTSGDALVDMTVVGNIKDVKIDKTAGEADVTTRDSGGWREKAPTLRECTITFKMLFLAANTNVTAIRSAYLNGTQIRLAALTDEKSSDGTTPAVGSEGVMGDFSITTCGRDEPLEEGVWYDVVAPLTKFKQYIIDGIETP